MFSRTIRFIRELGPRRAAAWLLRAAVAIAALRLIAPRPAYVVIGAPQTVDTAHPITCGHTRLTDEVEEWKSQRTLQMVREMGAPTIVEFLPSPYIETAPRQYNRARLDPNVQAARAQ